MERIRWVEASDKPASTRLPRNYASRSVGVALCSKRRLNAGAVGAPIYIPDFDATLLVNGHVEKVEQVAADVRAAVRPDTAALQCIVRCSVSCCPSLSAVECIGNIEMPDAVETVCGAISGCGRAIEGHTSAARIACHCRREGDVF